MPGIITTATAASIIALPWLLQTLFLRNTAFQQMRERCRRSYSPSFQFQLPHRDREKRNPDSTLAAKFNDMHAKPHGTFTHTLRPSRLKFAQRSDNGAGGSWQQSPTNAKITAASAANFITISRRRASRSRCLWHPRFMTIGGY